MRRKEGIGSPSGSLSSVLAVISLVGSRSGIRGQTQSSADGLRRGPGTGRSTTTRKLWVCISCGSCGLHGKKRVRNPW